jgi:hypothetical protein
MRQPGFIFTLVISAFSICASANTSRVTFDCIYDRIADKESTKDVYPKPLRMVFSFDITSSQFGSGTVQRGNQDFHLTWVFREQDRHERMYYHAFEHATRYELRTTTISQEYGPNEGYESVHSMHLKTPKHLVAYQYYGLCRRN